MSRIRAGSAPEIAGVVYGTIIVMAAITAGSKGGEPQAAELAGIVAGSVVVLWIAHVYAHSLAETISRGRRLDRAEFLSVARREIAMLLSGVLPIAALVLGALGLFKETTAVWLALGCGLLTLAVEGVRYATVERLSPLATIASVAVNVAFGLVIVGLKAGLAH
jgi:hypothetical protein